jgi:hypothetical protein
MHRLLLVEPTAKIMDMYASDMNYMIFKNIKEEYEQTRMAKGPQRWNATPDGWSDAKQGASDSRKPGRVRETRPSGNGKKWIWAGVAAATVAVGAGAYVMMKDEQSTPAEKEVRF